MKSVLLLLLSSLSVQGATQGATLRFDITDARGKKPGGVTVEASEPNESGWSSLKVQTKGKGSPVLVWPFDGLVKPADGPGEIPVVVMEPSDPRSMTNLKLIALLIAAEILGSPPQAGIDHADLMKAAAKLPDSDDPFAKGVGLLFAKKPANAADFLGRALRERERQLTRVPSEIYPAAVLYGRALLDAQRFDEAAVAFLKALKQRPSDPVASRLRAEALLKAGKAEAK